MSALFAQAIRELGRRQTAPDIELAFHPYAGLNSYIRVRHHRVRVGLSDILRDAPMRVHQALARILVAKLFHQSTDPESERVYRAFASRPEVRLQVESLQVARGRSVALNPRGRNRDLEATFNHLNKKLFNGMLPKPALGWSRKRSRTVLGYTDPVRKTLVISRLLDSVHIPEYVLEYIVYHEMLHVKHGTRILGGRRVFHTKAFRADEQRFPRTEQAERWLRRFSGRGLNASKKYF